MVPRPDLRSKRTAFTLEMAHRLLYSNGSHRETQTLVEQWGPPFQEHQLHAYLCGRDPDLQHLELEGLLTSLVLSGGGRRKTHKLDSDRKVP